jgi:AraC-like DNA-binding protein
MTPEFIYVKPALRSRLLHLGANVDKAMAMARIPASARVDTARYFAFWEALSYVSPPDIGLRLATGTTMYEYDLSLLAALHSPNVSSAFDKLSRYKRLCGLQNLKLTCSPEEVSVSTVWLNVSTPPPSRLVDMMVATLILLLQRGCGQMVTPKRLEFMRGSEDELMLMRYFSCPLVFHAARDAIIFDNSVLETPFLTHNASLLDVLLPNLDEQIAKLRGNSFLDNVREAVSRRMAGERPSISNIAREVSTSARTLQRRLNAYGTSYQQVLDDVRHDTARRLLHTTDIEFAEIAFLLGFEELNSFIRAFRRWEGQTPKQWRDGMNHRRDRV